MDIVIALALIALLVWREYLAYRERQSLVDRLMAKNLPEYKDNLAQEPNHVDPEPANHVVDLEEARDLIYGEEEE
jgi:hypothetical protein